MKFIPRVTPLYRALVHEIELHRRAKGWSMEEFCDLAGSADRYWAKAINADAPSGRQARMETLDEFCWAIFPTGFDVQIMPSNRKFESAADLQAALNASGTWSGSLRMYVPAE